MKNKRIKDLILRKITKVKWVRDQNGVLYT